MLTTLPLRRFAPTFRRSGAARPLRNGLTTQRRGFAQQNSDPSDLEQPDKVSRANGAQGSVTTEKRPQTASLPTVQQSLVEQLFPEEEATRKHHEATHDDHQLPRLPLESTEAPQLSRSRSNATSSTIGGRNGRVEDAPAGVKLENSMREQGSTTSVLVLRNASKNLTEEDFRRVIPQGKHMEGWTLEQGDIIKIVPGRDLETLAPTGYYFLLFSSPLSAFTYQGHVSRIHRMVASQSPKSLLSPVPPPPGMMIEGMDAHAAMESFTLVPPSQILELRQLKPPLTPMVSSIVRNGGYARLVHWPHRMPYEARLTFEGREPGIHAMRNVLNASGKRRGLHWSHSDSPLRINKWNPSGLGNAPSPLHHSSNAAKWIVRKGELDFEEEEIDLAHFSRPADTFGNPPFNAETEAPQQTQRAAPSVYIVGFATESALQSFVRYWHRRTIGNDENKVEGEERPPVANVEVLW